MAETEQTITGSHAVAPDTVRSDSAEQSAGSASELKPGEIWNGRFQIESVLRAGTVAVVYKATHIPLNAPMVLKVMRPRQESPDAVKRFMREARLLSAFSHENVVTLHSFGQDAQGLSFMALEFVEGPDLAKVIGEEKFLEPERAVFIARQICRALEAASVAEIVHRDLKPANIILSSQRGRGEHVKVIGFGLARANLAQLQLDQFVTTANFRGGSPAYMSPEQCQGYSVDARSDIYSVGCLLYEMICGVPPIQNESAFVLMTAQVNQVVDSVPARTEIPLSLRNIILKCLKKDPAVRYQSAAELETALGAINWDTMKLVKGLVHGDDQPSPWTKVLLPAIVGCLIIVPLTLMIFYQHSIPEKMTFPKAPVAAKALISKFLESRSSIANFPLSERIVYYNHWLDKFGNENTLDCAKAHFGLGQDLQLIGSVGAATEQYSQAAAIYLSITRKQHDQVELSDLYDAYSDLGSLLQMSGDKKGALEIQKQALQLLGEELSPLRKAHLHYGVASSAIEARELKLAEDSAKQACKLYEETGRTGSDFGGAMLLYATCLSLNGHRKHALAVVKQAEDMIGQDEQSGARVDWRCALAQAYFDLADFEQAAARYLEAQDLGGAYSASLANKHLTALIRWQKWNAGRKALTNILNRADSDSAADTWAALSTAVSNSKLLPDAKDVHDAVTIALTLKPDDPAERAKCVGKMIGVAYELQRGRRAKSESQRVLDAALVLLEDKDGSEQSATVPSRDLYLSLISALISHDELYKAIQVIRRAMNESRPPLTVEEKQRLTLINACALRFAGREAEAKQVASPLSSDTKSCDLCLYAAVALYDKTDNQYKILITQAVNNALRLRKDAMRSVLRRMQELNGWAVVHGDDDLAKQLFESARLLGRTVGGVTERDLYAGFGGNYLFAGKYENALDMFIDAYEFEGAVKSYPETRLGLLQTIVSCALAAKKPELAQKYDALIRAVVPNHLRK